MEVDFKELIELLSAEHKIYQQYLELLIEQQEYLVKNDLDGIRSSTERISQLAQQAANLESGRLAVLARLSATADMRTEDFNISRLIETFSGPGFDKLEQLQDTILETSQRICEQKTRNELLIEQSMNVITQTMQFVHNASNPKAVYDDPSRVNGGMGNQGAFISRMM